MHDNHVNPADYGVEASETKPTLYAKAAKGKFHCDPKDGDNFECESLSGVLQIIYLRWNDGEYHEQAKPGYVLELVLDASYASQLYRFVIRANFGTYHGTTWAAYLYEFRKGEPVKIDVWPYEDNGNITLTTMRKRDGGDWVKCERTQRWPDDFEERCLWAKELIRNHPCYVQTEDSYAPDEAQDSRSYNEVMERQRELEASTEPEPVVEESLPPDAPSYEPDQNAPAWLLEITTDNLVSKMIEKGRKIANTEQRNHFHKQIESLGVPYVDRFVYMDLLRKLLGLDRLKLNNHGVASPSVVFTADGLLTNALARQLAGDAQVGAELRVMVADHKAELLASDEQKRTDQDVPNDEYDPFADE